MNRKKILGLFLVLVSAIVYLIYPTPSLEDILLLSVVWIGALFGGSLIFISIEEDMKRKEEE